jgi:hypothetical protein
MRGALLAAVALALASSPASAFHPLMRPEQAPPLERPRTVSTAAAARLLRASDLVVGLALRGEERAYPLALLGYHRVVNDRLAGLEVAIAHSPLSGALTCARGERLRASGLLLESDDVLLDARSADLWSLLDGRGVGGPRHGRRLARVPCAAMRFDAWRRMAPRGRVAWPARPALAGADYRRDPWAWYRADDSHLEAPVRYLDLRLPRKQLVVGLAAGSEARAFVPPRRGRRAINVAVGGWPVTVVLDGDGGLALALDRRVGGRIVELALEERAGCAPVLRDRASDARWSLLGAPLSPRTAPLAAAEGAAVSYFFAWAAAHPGTSLAKEGPR